MSEHPWQLKLCSRCGTGAGLGALMVNLAWDERDWLLCDCGCSHQCHLCCHWQGAQLVLCHIQLFIAPHPPCRKTAVVVQWHKGGSRRSRSQARSSGKRSSGAAPGHSHCQSVLQPSSAPSSPTKNRAGTVESGEDQPGGQHGQEQHLHLSLLVRVHPFATSHLLWPGPASRSLSRQTEQWPQQKPPNLFHF